MPFVATCSVCGPDGQQRIVAALKLMGLWSGGGDSTSRTELSPIREIAAQTDDTWKCVTPIPDDVPPLPNSNPSMRWEYRDAEGRLLCYTERIEKPGGGKEINPWTWCVSNIGAKSWKRKALPAPHPLYGLDRLAKHPDLPVLVTEGEKKADTGERMLKSYVSVSWAGGVGRDGQADWTPLIGRDVIIWPDNDEVGKKAAFRIQERLKELDPERTASILKIPVSYDRGWDLWDAERKNWSTEHLLGFIEYGTVPVESIEGPAPDPDDADNRFFVALGVDRDVFYFRRVRNPQVVPRTPSQLANKGYLLALAPLNYWEGSPRYISKAGVDWTAATDHMIQRCLAKGIYNPGDVRARGAWLEDDGRLVFHTGRKEAQRRRRREVHQRIPVVALQLRSRQGLRPRSGTPSCRHRSLRAGAETLPPAALAQARQRRPAPLAERT